MTIDKTFVNGGNLLPGDLNKIQEDYEGSYLTWKHIQSGALLEANPTGSTKYVIGGGATTETGVGAFYINPADWEQSAVNLRTVKMRLSCSCLINGTAPGTTITVGLYPVSASTGSASEVKATLGTVVAESTAVFTTPAHETLNHVASNEFLCPAEGFYAMAYSLAASATSNCTLVVRATLQMRQK